VPELAWRHHATIPTSIRRERMKFRLKIAESEECISARSPPHYSLDGKMIEDTTGHKTVDRLLILNLEREFINFSQFLNLFLKQENQQFPQLMRQHYRGDFALTQL
jgi:hypothetical protein